MLRLILYKLKKRLLLRYLCNFKLPYIKIHLDYVNSMYKIHLRKLDELVGLLKTEIILGNIDKIKDTGYKKFLNQYQQMIEKEKSNVEDLDRSYKHEIRLYSYFYKHGYLSAKEKQIAETYLARYKDNLFKYETDFKHFDYKIAYKKSKIEQRLAEMEEDFNENLE